MRILSALIALSFVLSTPMMPIIAYAEDAPADSSAVGGDGGVGGGGGAGTQAGAGGDAGQGGGASGSAAEGNSSSTGGDGGTGGTGGDSTGGGSTGTGGSGGSGGTGGGAENTANGGSSDATGGDGGNGGTGGGSQASGDAGQGGNGATGGNANANSETDNGSDAAADANAGDGGSGGGGGDGNGANADGGAGGTGGSGGSTDASAEANDGGAADAGAAGGNGGNGGGGGSGGSGGSYVPPSNPDGQGSVIETGDANSGSTVDTSANTTNSDVPLGSEEGDDETEIEIGNVLGATTTATSLAETGDNTINDPDGSFIKTGIANSFAYLISLFNIAITNSNGSIVFLKNPIGEALNFTARFMEIFGEFARNGTCSLVDCELDDAVLSIYTDSVAEVSNTAITRSYTGENNATSTDGLASIETGDANAFSGIVNIGNLSIYDSRYLLILMANEGNLDGDILLPDGAFFNRLSTGAHIGARSDISASSTAEIENTAGANADTGDNGAYGTDGSEVASGDAKATASTMNFVNQLGAPICFIVNVGGEWHGSVIQLPERFSREKTPFGEVICGAGGAERDPVTGLEMEVVNYAKILNTAIADAVTGDNAAEGLMAKVATGDANAFAQILNLVNMTIIGQDWIFANFAVGGDWDGDLVFGAKPGEDDVLSELIETHVLGNSAAPSGGTVGGYEPDIEFTKNASVTQATSPAKVDYELVVHNKGGAAKQVVLEDTMHGPDGAVIGKQMWNLGTVKHNEEVKITYTIEFNGDVKPGYYTNEAVLTGMKNNAIGLSPLHASDVVEVLAPGEVLAAKSCEPVLTEYIKPWKINNRDQVKALQGFLNAYEGENLTLTGSYDFASQAAVKRFQTKHSADILSPWGISMPTGNVYYTTQKKVNQIACADLDFSLSADQQAEIESFKSSTQEKKEETIKKGNTGIVPKKQNILMMPAPSLPVFFKDASGGQPASTSALLKNQLKGFASWLMFAPLVEALEI